MRPGSGCIVLAATLAASAPAVSQESLSFRDDFNGTELAPEFRVLKHDPNRMAMVDGEHLLLLTHLEHKNQIVYVEELPDEYEIIVEFASLPTHTAQGFGVTMTEGDNALYAEFILSNWGGSQFNFGKKLDGEFSNFNRKVNGENAEAPIFIKIIRDGIRYELDTRINLAALA